MILTLGTRVCNRTAIALAQRSHSTTYQCTGGTKNVRTEPQQMYVGYGTT
jgi:hypothetical protein